MTSQDITVSALAFISLAAVANALPEAVVASRPVYDEEGTHVYTDCDVTKPQLQNVHGLLSGLRAKRPDNSLRPLEAVERASLKGCEIAKIGPMPRETVEFSGASYDIQIVEMNPIEGGVEVFARAWTSDGTQIGFGADGSVDIERFRFFNPPVLVPDSQGEVVLEQRNARGESIGASRYREDVKGALLQSLVHTVSVLSNKHPGSSIEPGKRGNTTSTFYPEAGDGRTGYINQSSWATTRGANGSTANATDYTSNNIQIGAEDESAAANDFAILRGFLPFNTSAIADADTISSATLSLWVQNAGAGERLYGVILTTQASTAQVVGTDYDNLTLNSPVEGTASRISLTSTAAYTDAALDADGIGWISKTGNTLLGLRHQDDIDNTQPAAGRQYMHIHSSEATGTTNDPKLVVEHSSATAVSASTLIIFE